jgi:dTDP-4-dehydrorhamnose 3,5-epimerase
MKLTPTRIPDVVIVEPPVFADERGWFMESFNERRFHQALQELGCALPGAFVQDNHSRSAKGVLRGLHYQIEQAQGKLVRASLGEIFDVAVDLRADSPTFGQWAGALLSAENKRQLWVPPGFAHGFYVVSDTAEFQYKCTDYYAPQHERSLKWDDPMIGIEWPIAPGETPILSNKDLQASTLSEAQRYR